MDNNYDYDGARNALSYFIKETAEGNTTGAGFLGSSEVRFKYCMTATKIVHLTQDLGNLRLVPSQGSDLKLGKLVDEDTVAHTTFKIQGIVATCDLDPVAKK